MRELVDPVITGQAQHVEGCCEIGMLDFAGYTEQKLVILLSESSSIDFDFVIFTTIIGFDFST